MGASSFASCIAALGDLVLDSAGDAGLLTAVTADSRAVCPGMIFVAIRGAQLDGQRFVLEAMTRGAAVVVYDGPPQVWDLPSVRVRNSYRAWGVLAEHFAGKPGEHLTWLGVTGTNGKSTTALLVHHLLQHAGIRAGLISTIWYHCGDQPKTADRTTPMPDQWQELVAEMAGNGCSHAVCELSSHALDQGRIGRQRMQVAGFTNLTQDHLDYHHSMAAYFEAKSRLFSRYLEPEGTAVLNGDDPAGRQLIERSVAAVQRYGTASDWSASEIQLGATATRFRLRGAVVDSPLVGAYNVANAVLAIAMVCQAGVTLEQACEGLATFPGVPGRLERVGNGRPAVLVDYAHTDDALANALRAARGLPGKRLVVVFGCGGDRDRGKRPKMARAAEQLADRVYVTSDNPRTECPEQILADIRAGFVAPAQVVELIDRRAAICAAIADARPDDIILIAGKGHETYQEINGEKYDFDDRQVAAAALRATFPGC